MRIYLPEKVIFTEAASPRRMSHFRVDKSFCLPKLKSITVLLYDLSTQKEYCLLSLVQLVYIVAVMFKLRTFSQ